MNLDIDVKHRPGSASLHPAIIELNLSGAPLVIEKSSVLLDLAKGARTPHRPIFRKRLLGQFFIYTNSFKVHPSLWTVHVIESSRIESEVS
ncbi:hypothetical protein CDAR_95451 [Caerostris darwini]|uniref:Uncharacterized protein n=1 Tax=Caerostris darwini TaxID=1538125 RepID=A0AAV4PKA1_9ARAC|nr:hypothetical protein CDAR_95451 [Caerostris darwini]